MRLWDDDEEEKDEDTTESPSAKEILRDPNLASKESDRQYIRITKEQFEKCLEESAVRWAENPDVQAGEIVYDSPYVSTNYDNIVMRCYSTISKSSDQARDKGSDAIRLVLFDTQIKRPVGGRKKTLRIKTFCKNLKEKIRDLAEETEQFVTICDECGGMMVIQTGKYGEFFGCRNYPDCENTEQLD